MATKQLAKTFNYGVRLQTDWANPEAAGAVYKTVPYDAGVTVFDPDVFVERHNTTGQSGIHREFERVYVDSRSGLPKVNFNMPADVKTLAPHLVGALFVVSEAAGGAFTKNISAGGLTAVIDFNADDAQLHTIAMDDQASADDGIILENAIIENLTLSWDFIANGTARLVQVNGNWIGNEMNFEQTTNGTWTTTTFTPMNDTDTYTFTTLTSDGVDIKAETVRRFTFNVANNVTTNSATTVGKPNNFDVSPVYTSQVLLDYNSTTEKILKDFQDGATVTATIDSSLSSGASGNLTITLVGGIIQRQPFGYNAEFGATVLDVMWHSVAAAVPVTISFTDAVDYGY